MFICLRGAVDPWMYGKHFLKKADHFIEHNGVVRTQHQYNQQIRTVSHMVLHRCTLPALHITRDGQNRIFNDFLAKNTVYTPYIYVTSQPYTSQ